MPGNIKWLLVGSIAVNLLLAGALVAHLLTPHGIARFRENEGFFDRRAAMTAISEEYRPRVRAVWQHRIDERRGEFQDIVRERRRLRELLLADRFDFETYEEAERELHERGMAARRTMQGTLAEIADLLPAEERRRFFDAGFSGHRMRRHGRRR